MGQLRRRAISARHAPGCSALSASPKLFVSSKVAHPPSDDESCAVGPFLRAVAGTWGRIWRPTWEPVLETQGQDCVPAVVYMTLARPHAPPSRCRSALSRPADFGFLAALRMPRQDV
jgi:hypothetical protein